MPVFDTASETKEHSRRPEHEGVIGEFAYEEETWTSWTPRVGLDYSLSDDVLLYFTVSEGFKSGGLDFGGSCR